MSALGDEARRAASLGAASQDDEHTARARCLSAQARYLEAASWLAEVEAVKVAGEVAQQPLEARRLESAFRREEAEREAVASARFRAEVMLVMFLLILVLVLGLASVNPAYLRELGGAGGLGVLLAAAGQLARTAPSRGRR
jgi:hypothetical protein